jgi:hypothetical protein
MPIAYRDIRNVSVFLYGDAPVVTARAGEDKKPKCADEFAQP